MPKQPNILEYIAQQLSKCKVTDAKVKAEQLLEQGKALVLLDGPDEVQQEGIKRVLGQIQEFSHQFHTNQFVITCRIAAKEIFKQWWQVKGQVWAEQLRAVMIQHRNIGHDWQFTNSEKKLLQQYYDANKLLIDCLNSDCYVSREVRQEIENTLLLPVKR